MSTIQRWRRHCGDTVFVIEGIPEDPSSQIVRRIESETPMQERQKAAQIPPGFRNSFIENWDDRRSNPGARAVVEACLRESSHSLYLFGSVGVGKTYCALTIGNELLRLGKTVRFCAVSDLLLTIRASYSDSPLTELDILEPLFSVDCLILDEMGDVRFAGNQSASDFQASRILNLLDRRCREGRSVAITSNLSLADLVRWTKDERIGSRIREMCGDKVVELGGRDLRFDSQETGTGGSV